jgi:hypothetical protein
MALIDFYGLAALYELRRSYAGFPSASSHSPMSSARSSRSPAPPVEPHGVQSSLPPTQPEPKTPERKRGASHSVSAPGITPLSVGTAMRRTQDAGVDKVSKFKRADYDGYIREDLGSRVFVDFEVFIKSVLTSPKTGGPNGDRLSRPSKQIRTSRNIAGNTAVNATTRIRRRRYSMIL